MKVFDSISEWMTFRKGLTSLPPSDMSATETRQQISSNIRPAINPPHSLGFVPTMGALHEGHISLVQKSKLENSNTLVSIFVNPTQFNNSVDFEKYPTNISRDLLLLENTKVDFVLLPNTNDIYPGGNTVKVTENQDSKILCGAYRPGHFDGVLTIMNKLLNIAAAQNCYMGEKDYQQLHLVKEMVQNFFLPTNIIACPTVREKNGLAMSSRNERLSPAAREKAAMIYKYLKQPIPCEEISTQLKAAGFEVDYVEEHWHRKFVAAHLEGVRLIDNVEC